MVHICCSGQADEYSRNTRLCLNGQGIGHPLDYVGHPCTQFKGTVLLIFDNFLDIYLSGIQYCPVPLRFFLQLIDEAVPYSCIISDIIVWNRFVDKLFWKENERKNGKAQSLSVPRIWCWSTIQYCKLFHFLVCGYTILKNALLSQLALMLLFFYIFGCDLAAESNLHFIVLYVYQLERWKINPRILLFKAKTTTCPYTDLILGSKSVFLDGSSVRWLLFVPYYIPSWRQRIHLPEKAYFTYYPMPRLLYNKMCSFYRHNRVNFN